MVNVIGKILEKNEFKLFFTYLGIKMWKLP